MPKFAQKSAETSVFRAKKTLDCILHLTFFVKYSLYFFVRKDSFHLKRFPPSQNMYAFGTGAGKTFYEADRSSSRRAVNSILNAYYFYAKTDTQKSFNRSLLQ